MAQYDAWLAALKAAGKGGMNYPQLTIDRGLDYSRALSFSADYSGDDFLASLRASPDGDPLSPPIDFAITVGAYTDGKTLVTLELTDTETAAIPADDDLDGEERFYFDLLRNGARIMAGTIPVAGKVTDAS